MPLNLIGDGLLPPDIDGKTKPKNDVPAPIVGTQDDDGPYGATFDALNIWEFDVKWRSTPTASIVLQGAAAGRRVRLGVPVRRPTRLPGTACRSRASPTRRSSSTSCPTGSGRSGGSPTATQGRYETMVTNQSVEALPGLGGTRWYEIRRTERHVHRPPAGHLRARRRRPPLDGQHRHGQEGQHGARLQRRQRHRRLPGHPLHGPARRRPAGPDDARRGHGHQRHAACRRPRTRAGATTPR